MLHKLHKHTQRIQISNQITFIADSVTQLHIEFVVREVLSKQLITWYYNIKAAKHKQIHYK
jgi:hypothetical protein